MSTPPRIGLVGSFPGRTHEGWVLGPGEVLGELLARDGFPTVTSSAVLPPVPRTADIVRSLCRWRGHVDVVIVNVLAGRGFAVAEAAVRTARAVTRSKVVLWLHSGSFPAFATRHPRQVRRVLGMADAVVAPSRFLVDALVDVGVEIEVIPNVIDLDAYDFRPRCELRPRLLWMRTFYEHYNPGLAIDALALLREEHPDATLTMGGQDKGLLDVTRARAHARGVGDVVRFPGFLDDEAKAREFADHDLYLHTNDIDNMPVSLVEAGSYGVPVVATEVGGVPHLVDDGETALLVPPRDPVAMAAACSKLLADPALAHRLSTSGRVHAEQFGWEAVRPRWQALFERVLG